MAASKFEMGMMKLEEAIQRYQGYLNDPMTFTPETARTLMDTLKSSMTLFRVHGQEMKDQMQMDGEHAALKKLLNRD